MEREVGGGIGMGNTCKPMAVSFQCMTKSTTIKNNNNNNKKKVRSTHRGPELAGVLSGLCRCECGLIYGEVYCKGHVLRLKCNHVGGL